MVIKRKIALILFILIGIFLLTSCGNTVSTSEAKKYTTDFLEAIVANEYEKAEEFLHPDAKEDEDVIEDFVKQLTDNNIILSGDVTDLKTTSINVAPYTSEHKGSSCKIGGTVKVGGVTYNFICLVVNNKAGKGIFAFNIEKD